MRIQLRNTRFARFLLHPVGKFLLGLSVGLTVVVGTVFVYQYVRFAKLIDRRLQGDVFARTSRIYASPESLFVGQEATVAELTGKLRRAGYNENKTNRIGWYHEIPGGLEVFPGADSYFQDEPAVIRIAEGKIEKIISLRDNAPQQQYELEPILITNLFDQQREKRRLLRFEDLPPNLVNAILAAEDKSFFQHSGLDYARILKAAYEDIRAWNRNQGASTLTSQLAREFFLTPAKTPKRKAAEALIAIQLERRLTKQQIFEFYCNQIYMGQRGSFSLRGMSEASLAYFGKEVRQLTLPEAAFLAGMIRGPNIYNPYRYPDRAHARRNRIIEAMHRIGAITAEQRDEAAKLPLKVVPHYIETGDAPYFVDLVREQLLEKHPEKELLNASYKVYTTLDTNLQRAAVEAMRVGTQYVDEQFVKLAAKRKNKQAYPQAQAALVAIDPHTGEVKALVGGRYYGTSQLNRAVAMRQPGSAFKPFVFAAAFNSAIDGARPLVTPVTVVDDSPTTFVYDGGTYEPSNYRDNFRGMVNARYALAHSLNVATIKIGEMAGFDKVSKLAREAGLTTAKGTPSVALGSYESSPLELAGAYTIFANNGKRVDPFLIRMVRRQNGQVIEEHKVKEKPVLDPRVATLMTRLMEGVVTNGTGAGVRARGFTAPAAGKTGTSHDGWFAGYTSNLLAIVWVGFDDNRELPLSGSQSALPIWTEFMKRASSVRQYRNMAPFTTPPGLTSAEVDPVSGQLASAYCPERRPEVFIEGTLPTEVCMLHTLNMTSPSLPPTPFGLPTQRPIVAPAGAPPTGVALPGQTPPTPADGAEAQNGEQRKRGFFGRVFGVFKGDEKPKPPPEQRPQ